MGTPCAGQVRAIPAPSSFSKAERDNMEENFGLEKPIGSKEISNEKIPVLDW